MQKQLRLRPLQRVLLNDDVSTAAVARRRVIQQRERIDWDGLIGCTRLGVLFVVTGCMIKFRTVIIIIISNLSDNRSTASSKTIPPLNAI
jgi:hypothetical protein